MTEFEESASRASIAPVAIPVSVLLFDAWPYRERDPMVRIAVRIAE
jgi:hypothetical protein